MEIYNLHAKIFMQVAVKKIILRKYQDRMRHRPPHPDIAHILKVKDEIARKIINICRETKSLLWKMKDMEKILTSLKSNKSCDPHCFIYELFKPGVIATDLQISLLELFNRTKREMKIPEFMEYLNISSVYKNKNCKLDINSY